MAGRHRAGRSGSRRARPRSVPRASTIACASFATPGAFTVPARRRAGRSSARIARSTAVDAAWLDESGFDSSRCCAGTSNYACRDDYGALASDVSAWAGVHYFASRERPTRTGPLTWPEGNGWIVRRLLERVGAHVETSVMIERLEHRERRVDRHR